MNRVVLLVDDDADVLHVLSRHLRDEPCQVYTARSGDEAIDLLMTRQVHVVVADERMPAMQGTDLLEWIAVRVSGGGADRVDRLRDDGDGPAGDQRLRGVAVPDQAVQPSSAGRHGPRGPGAPGAAPRVAVVVGAEPLGGDGAGPPHARS